MKIIWVSDHKIENGCYMWKSPSGVIEISYKIFVDEVISFFRAFYSAMDRQVENAVNRDWGDVSLDKIRLVNENAERKEGFNQMLDFLSKTPSNTDWDSARGAYQKMLSRIEGIVK